MLPGNVDPRRPDKVQRYKPPTANANGQGEDLTPDYMNILGQRATTANAAAEATADKHVVDGVSAVNVSTATIADPNLQAHQTAEEAQAAEETATNSNTTNVIPTSPQYGVAIIPTNVSIADLPTETVTISTDTVIDSTAKQTTDDSKDLHSTPSRNDRFKVVKIASLEPFKRGRWKCMDYVDEAPPPIITQPSKVTQSTGSITVPAGGVYLQTQSLPQQQIQQMLLQSGYTNGTQFFQSVPTQMIPQTQYFYPPGANMQTQTLPQQLVNTSGVPSSMPAQFINTSQPYFAAGVMQNPSFAIPPNYQNVQYVPANILQNQNSAFVPTSQPVQLPANFQQSQTYAGPNVTAPMVNGHAFPQQNEQQQNQQQPQQQVTSSSLPTQVAKSVILNTSVQQPVVSQSQISQPTIQNQIPVVQNSTQSQSVPVIQNQQYQQNTNFQQIPNQAQNSTQVQPNVVQNTQVFDQNQTATKVVPGSAIFEQNQAPQIVSVPSILEKNQASNVYTNPQFDMNVNSLTVLENQDASAEAVNEANSGTEVTSDNPDDPSKTNPVVNAIDNKIEQAMDLVKSHLMYTVREEVEVLKEKIAELMERIQQLETENNFLRSQIPKSQAPGAATPVLSTSTPIVNPATTTTTSTAPSETRMIFSMCGLMMRLKWCAWVALYCSCISFANSRLSDDTKQILSSFMLSISAIVMSYLQNPQPMTPPWASSVN